MEPQLTEDEERFMRWLEEKGDVTAHEADVCADVPGHWLEMRCEAKSLGYILRVHLPRDLEPPDPDTFNSQIHQRLGWTGNGRQPQIAKLLSDDVAKAATSNEKARRTEVQRA